MVGSAGELQAGGYVGETGPASVLEVGGGGPGAWGTASTGGQVAGPLADQDQE